MRNYFLKLKINCTKHEFREHYVIYWWQPSNKVLVKEHDRMKFWIPWNADLHICLKCTKHSKHPVLFGIFPVFENILYQNIFIFLIMPFHWGEFISITYLLPFAFYFWIETNSKPISSLKFISDSELIKNNIEFNTEVRS